MKKKAFAIFITLVLLLQFLPSTAAAEVIAINNSGTIDISGYNNTGNTININPGLEVTLTGNAANISVNCDAGVKLTLNSITIDDSVSPGMCPITFNGSGNQLILDGDSNIKGYDTSSNDYNGQPGIRVEGSAELEILGEGSLNATGGLCSAGIGGDYESSCGTVSISGGTVTANGGGFATGIGNGMGSGDSTGKVIISGGTVNSTGNSFCAGIGGGYVSGCVIVSITGGTVNAQGGQFGAGIGGYGNYDGTVSISGGTVNAVGGQFGPGIGNIGTIFISGGTVTAMGGESGAGIGGIRSSSMGTVSISGGLVFAAGGGLPQGVNTTPPYDIGNGAGNTAESDTLNISGDAAVFVKNGRCYAPATFHEYYAPTADENVNLFGITLPDGWTSAGAYIVPRQIVYDDNGGIGTKVVTVHRGTASSIADEAGFLRSGYTFSGWNTSPDGSGTTYSQGDSLNLTGNLMLYAMWDEVNVESITLNSHIVNLAPGDITALRAAVSVGYTAAKIIWSSSNENVAAVDSNGVVTAAGPGSAVITAEAGGKTDICQVNVTRILMKLQLPVGNTINISATVNPDEAVTWSSSDEDVAAVDSNGVVTGVSAGFATISAEAGGISDAFIIEVVQKDRKYIVIYDGNGAESGIVPVDNGSYLQGEAVNLAGNPGNLERYGYKFLGWNTDPEATTALTIYAMGSDDAKLYAVWEAKVIVSPLTAKSGSKITFIAKAGTDLVSTLIYFMVDGKDLGKAPVSADGTAMLSNVKINLKPNDYTVTTYYLVKDTKVYIGEAYFTIT